MVDWKKEIKLSDLVRRKPKDDALEDMAEQPEPAPTAAEETIVPLPDPAPEPLPAPPPPVEPALPTLPSEPFAPNDIAPAAEVSPELPPEPAAVPPAAAPPPLLATPRAAVPPPRPGIHPPVPAAALDPEPVQPDPEPPSGPEKTSFLKKEISFGRKSREPKEPKEPKKPKKLKEPKGEKSSFLKKEISFGRKPKQPEPKQPKAEKPAKPKGEKGSFLKKEFSFRRKASDATVQPEQPDGAEETKAREPKAKKRRSGRKAPAAHKRHKRLVGLKIGASQLAAARVVNNGDPELVQIARMELEPGVVVGGELREPELLAEALKEFFRKHRLPRQDVRLGIANNRIGVRVFDIAGVDEPRQLENAIRFRAQEALPIPIEEAVLDYHVLSETTDEDGALTRRILLVVAYRELIDRYIGACKKAGIKLAGIDLEAFALLRALGEPPADAEAKPEAALVVVAIGHERSTFAVSDGSICEFTRVLDWGGSTVNVAIARALDIAPSEAEPIKHEFSLAVAIGLGIED